MPEAAVVVPARQRILDSAYELFSRRGVRAVGVDEVIKTASVAKATLYRHFKSKDELVLAFLQQREELWTRGWVEAAARPPRSGFSRSSTSSTSGSRRTTSKAAPSSTSCSR